MNVKDTVVSKGVRVHKSFGETVISYLKDKKLISHELKISRTNDDLIIPVIENLDLKKIRLDLDSNVSIVTAEFSTKKIRPSSIRAILEISMPQNLISFIPSAFDQIGNIAVVELKPQIIDHKKSIGESILSFIPSINAVYSKSSAVSGLTRIRELELIAGEDIEETIHKEFGINIFVNVKQIYFSPRLSNEHNRIATQVRIGELILDMFGAAAPFSLHISKLQDVRITTLDINEAAPNMIIQSIKLNPDLKGKIEVITGDAKVVCQDFIESGKSFDRIIMNHPSEALSYVLLADKLLKKNGLIHLYTFVILEDHDLNCEQIIDEYLEGYSLIDITRVRQYSPSESHTCLTVKKE